MRHPGSPRGFTPPAPTAPLHIMKIAASAFALLSLSSAASSFVIIDRITALSLPTIVQKVYNSASRFNTDYEPEYRLVQIDEQTPPEWMTEDDKLELFQKGIKFMDVTDNQNLGKINALEARPLSSAFPKPSQQSEVKNIIGNLTTEYMKSNLAEFTSFHNRYYKSEYGASSAKWLYTQVTNLIDAAETDYVSARKFKHTWGQHSVIARIEPAGYKGDETVIIGAHQDSANIFLPQILAAPGADDDGSGSVTILEAFRALLATKFEPKIPVEFHWYSAEEGGLLGSQAIATSYEQAGANVKAMIQMDMTGYVGNGKEVIGVISDYVDPELTKFVQSLVKTYTKLEPVDTKCGYACSDHASWRKAGYPSAFTIESTFEGSNKAIHSTNDKIDLLSFDHMLEFSKLAVGFAVELGKQK